MSRKRKSQEELSRDIFQLVSMTTEHEARLEFASETNSDGTPEHLGDDEVSDADSEQNYQREVLRVLENMQTDLYSIHAEVKHIAGLIQDIREPTLPLDPKIVRQHVLYYLFTQFPKAAVIKESTAMTNRHKMAGYLKLSTKLGELSDTCVGTPYDKSKIAPYMRTLRLQFRTDLLAALDRQLKATPERAPAFQLGAGLRFLEEIAQLLIDVIFDMFKERGIYSKRAVLNSTAWRPEYETICDELHAVISPNLVAFGTCLVSGVTSGHRPEVTFRALSDTAAQLSRILADTEAATVDNFTNLTAHGFRESAEFFDGAATPIPTQK